MLSYWERWPLFSTSRWRISSDFTRCDRCRWTCPWNMPWPWQQFQAWLQLWLRLSLISQRPFILQPAVEFRTSKGWRQELYSLGPQCSRWVLPSLFLTELTALCNNSPCWPDIALLRPKLSCPWQLWCRSEVIFNLTALPRAFFLGLRAGPGASVTPNILRGCPPQS